VQAYDATKGIKLVFTFGQLLAQAGGMNCIFFILSISWLVIELPDRFS